MAKFLLPWRWMLANRAYFEKLSTAAPSRFVIFKATFVSSTSRSSPAASNPGTAGRTNNDAHWIKSLQRLGVRGQSLAIELEILLVHDDRASIHGRRHRRRQGGTPVVELMDRVVVQVVEEF